MSYAWAQVMQLEPSDEFDCVLVSHKMYYTLEEGRNLRRIMLQLGCTLQVAILYITNAHSKRTCPYCAKREKEQLILASLCESEEQHVEESDIVQDSEVNLIENEYQDATRESNNQCFEDGSGVQSEEVDSREDYRDEDEDCVAVDDAVVASSCYVRELLEAQEKWLPHRLRMSMYKTAQDMGKYLQQHSYVYAWIYQMIKHLDGFYVPGDGPGMMSYLLKKNNKKYVSSEPNPIGDMMWRLGFITNRDYFDRNYEGIGLFLNVDQFFYPDTKKKFVMYVDNPKLTYLDKYVVKGTQRRLYSNIEGLCVPTVLDWRPRVKKIMQRLEGVCGATDMIHKVLIRDFCVPVRDKGLVLGPGRFNVMTRQDYFVPRSDYIYGTRSSVVIVKNTLNNFFPPALLYVDNDTFRVVRCLFREALIHKVKRKWGVLVVSAVREHKEFLGSYNKQIGRYRVVRIMERTQERVYHQVELDLVVQGVLVD